MAVNNRHLLLVSDFVADGLVPLLKPELSVTVAPFDQVSMVLLDPQHACWRDEPDAMFVWTRPEGIVKGFARLLQGEQVSLAELLAETEQFMGQILEAARRVDHLFVASWTVKPFVRGLGMLALHPDVGHAHHLLRMNLRMMELAQKSQNIYILDAGRWQAHAGPAAYSPKLWHLGKIAFGPAAMAQSAGDLIASIHALEGRTRKLLVLDLDDILWGGTVGEEGWEKLCLGGHNPIGEAFVAFQMELKALQRRGILLGIVSKNSETVALEAIDRHPEMVLRRDDFVAWRINWQDKVQNLRELAEEVNLSLDACVFIDDHPAERARVRDGLPDVMVPEWPTDILLYAQALNELRCFDPAALTADDRQRSDMYLAERQRKSAQSSSQTLEAFLESLQLRVIVERLNEANLSRAAQLLNKTNQMNLTTRRMTEAQLKEQNEGNRVAFVFRVADRFGEYGVTGLASLALNGDCAVVTDFVVSCRVMGRGVENAMLHVLTEHAGRHGARRIEATYHRTNRNMPLKSFFETTFGTTKEASDDRTCYTWNTVGLHLIPPHIRLEGELLI
jgi:FkbH-like protein